MFHLVQHRRDEGQLRQERVRAGGRGPALLARAVGAHEVRISIGIGFIRVGVDSFLCGCRAFALEFVRKSIAHALHGDDFLCRWRAFTLELVQIDRI